MRRPGIRTQSLPIIGRNLEGDPFADSIGNGIRQGCDTGTPLFSPAPRHHVSVTEGGSQTYTGTNAYRDIIEPPFGSLSDPRYIRVPNTSTFIH